MAVSTPHQIAGARPRPSATQAAPVVIAAAGTSLIGASDCISAIGLVAANAAAIAPVHGPSTRRPRTNVSQTISNAQRGVTRYGPHAPNVSAAAMINGNPGAYVGTMVCGDSPGR